MLYQDRAGIIGFVQIATVILGLLQFVGSTLILIYGVEESSTLTSELQDVFLKLVYDYDNDKNARALLAQIMEYVSESKHRLQSGASGLLKRLGCLFHRCSTGRLAYTAAAVLLKQTMVRFWIRLIRFQ